MERVTGRKQAIMTESLKGQLMTGACDTCQATVKGPSFWVSLHNSRWCSPTNTSTTGQPFLVLNWVYADIFEEIVGVSKYVTARDTLQANMPEAKERWLGLTPERSKEKYITCLDLTMFDDWLPQMNVIYYHAISVQLLTMGHKRNLLSSLPEPRGSMTSKKGTPFSPT